MFNSNNGYSLSDIAAATGNNNSGWGFGNDGGVWMLILFIIVLMGGWNGNGWGNGNGGNGSTTYIANDVQRGFDQAAVTTSLNGISTGICNGNAALQQALCSGFAGVNSNMAGGFAGVNGAISNGFAQAEIANNARQMADMQQTFAIQSALQQCCCDNRAAVADLKYTVATENCADRASVNDALRDVIANQTAGIQTILDKLCQQEIDALKAQNQQLQMQNYLANLAASQNAQTGQILNDNTAQTTTLLRALDPAPVPAYIVQNPNGCNCGSYNGCGGNGFYN